MFRLISLFSIKKISSRDKVVYLTFDDGPEPGITEYILWVLKKYNAKATFFCTGVNFEKYPDLIKLLKDSGHVLGNHTYSHMNGLEESHKTYLKDVDKGRKIIGTNLFRPPWGVLSLYTFIKIRRHNKIILWNISSHDFIADTDWNINCKKMITNTKPGSIILFHFCQKHTVGTKMILPKYIEEVSRMGFKFSGINLLTTQ